MRAKTHIIVQGGIGCEGREAALPAPLLNSKNESTTGATLPDSWFHKPTLDMRARPGVNAIHKWADGNGSETANGSILAFPYEHLVPIEKVKGLVWPQAARKRLHFAQFTFADRAGRHGLFDNWLRIFET